MKASELKAIELKAIENKGVLMILHNWATRTCMLLLAAVGLTLATAPNALAHNELVSSNPTAGAVLDAVPTTVELVFEQVIDAAHADVAISDGSGGILDVAVEVDGTAVRATVKQPPAAGSDPVTWQVGYRMLSADGHSMEGVIEFVVDGPDTPAEPPVSPAATEAPAPVISSAEPSQDLSTLSAAGDGDAPSAESASTASTITQQTVESAPATTSESAAGSSTPEQSEVVAAASATPSTESSSAWIWILGIAVAVIGVAAVLRLRRSNATGSK